MSHNLTRPTMVLSLQTWNSLPASQRKTEEGVRYIFWNYKEWRKVILKK